MRKLIFVLSCLSFALTVGSVLAVERLVPSQYTTIQSAIDDCNNGDVVIIDPNTYTGPGNRDIDFNDLAITVRSTNPSNPSVVASTVIDCNGTQAQPHRGFYFHRGEGSDSVVSGLTITNGFATRGGGISCETSSPTISNCVITNNTAEDWNFGSAGGGGGISCYNFSSPTIYNCVIKDNNGSGSITAGGGILCESNSHPKITNCIIENNSSVYGGGILCCFGSNPVVLNCTIYSNAAATGGGGIYAFADDYIKIQNSILWNNTPGSGGGPEIFVDNGLLGGEPSQCVVSYSDVKGGSAAVYVASGSTLYWQPSNLDTDPCFADPYNSDYHLKSQAGRYDPNTLNWIQDANTSPCIDAGDPNSPIGYEPFPNGGLVNMGAYGGTVEASKSYFGGPVCETIVAGDINGDCVIDFKDFAFMAMHWLEDNNP